MANVNKQKSESTIRGVDMSAAMRVSFLEQVAILLSSQSSKKGDVMNSLSSAAMKDLKEISYVEQIRPSMNIKRSICKNCKVYLVPDKNGKPAIELRQKRKRLIRKCLNCDHEVSYLWNPRYKSRNEKAVEVSKSENTLSV